MAAMKADSTAVSMAQRSVESWAESTAGWSEELSVEKAAVSAVAKDQPSAAVTVEKWELLLGNMQVVQKENFLVGKLVHTTVEWTAHS